MPEDWNLFPFRGVGPIDGIFHDDQGEFQLLRLMAQEAENYLQGFSWCKRIREAYFGGEYGGIVAVFLFRISPSMPQAGEWFWVVTGDVPTACLQAGQSKAPSEALENYIWEMTRWVHFAKRGQSPDDVIPVNLSPTWKNAEELEDKLKVLRKVVVPAFQAREAMPS